MLSIKGSVTGTVMRMVETSSRNVPNKIYSAITAIRIQNGDKPMARTHWVNSFGNCVRTMKREKINAPSTMKKIVAVV